MSDDKGTPRRVRTPERGDARPESKSEGKGCALARLIESLPPARRDHVFTHTSWATDRGSSYERLEFLGDSVLELSIARAVYDRFPDAPEGRLAKIRAHVVSRHSCAAVAKELDLGRLLLEQARDVPEAELDRIVRSRNVLAALLEAAIAAVYLEHGFKEAERAVVEAFDSLIEFACTGHIDNKTELQEALARSGNQVQYSVVDVEGPPHDRRFVCVAVIAGEQVGIGRASTKKAAEQGAARQALEAMAHVAPRLP
ncbi:MAG: ribonuclease III [Thermoleophilia bacterium]|nr:ribonuclease III [Thermoleophilia bacterium]